MNKEKIIIDFKNKGGSITCAPNILKLLREKFSVTNPVYIKRRFDPRKYVVTPSGAFQLGLWYEIKSYLDTLKFPTSITVTPEFKAQFQPKIPYDKIETIQGFTYYDYQEEMIRQFLENGRGIGMLGTSGGKTLICGGFCKTLLVKNPTAKILIIVPNIGLLNQTYRDFTEKFSIDDVTIWGGGAIPDDSKSIMIANTQILLSDIKASVKRLKHYNYVIVDEVHTIGDRNNKINKVIYNIDTPNKFGLTGTMPDKLLAAWNIIGKIGPILLEESSYDIRKKGTATEVEVKVIICKHGKIPKIIDIDPNKPTAHYDNESLYLYTHKERNDFIMNLAEKLDGNVLILVDKLIHGNKLSMYKTKKKSFFVNGSMPVPERKAIQDRMEVEDDIIVTAMTQIFSTGISINNIKYVIFTAIGKSNIRVSQSIGRSMRLHPNKKKSYIFDIADNSPYSLSHLRIRLELYKEEKIDYTIKKIKL